MRTARAPSHGERGITLPEILVVLLFVFILAMVAATYSMAWLHAEELRSAIYQTQTLLQLARTESVTRNRECSFEVDTNTGRIQVRDLNGTSSTSDDITLADIAISSKVSFASPDVSPAMSLTDLTGGRWGAVFASTGGVTSGAGVITMRGKDRYNRISLFGAGGTKVERWMGSVWRTGT